jgi:hypothetical protein
MDPFGVVPEVFPYWLFDQGIGHMMERILHVEAVAHKAKGHVWIFVLKA